MVYRAALIGCGKIGSEYSDDPRTNGISSHAQAYTVCSDTRLVAVCDSDPIKSERCSARWPVAAWYYDAGKMFAEQRPDIVSICTPDSTHYDLLQAAIAAPGVRAVLAEKPLTLKLEHAREIVQLARERGVLLAVNYSRRYADSYLRLREFLRSNGIGPIQTVGGYYTKGLFHNGTHWFDLARLLVGEVRRVWGVDVKREGGADPTLDAFVEFNCGAGGHLQGCDATAFTLFEMDIVGTRGRVRIVESGQKFEVYQVENSVCTPGYRMLVRADGPTGGLENPLLRAVEDLVRCLREGGQPRCSGEDGVAALQIAHAVSESAPLGRMVLLRNSVHG